MDIYACTHERSISRQGAALQLLIETDTVEVRVEQVHRQRPLYGFSCLPLLAAPKLVTWKRTIAYKIFSIVLLHETTLKLYKATTTHHFQRNAREALFCTVCTPGITGVCVLLGLIVFVLCCPLQIVVMACREVEMGKKKCQRYWPNLHESKLYGSVQVTTV